MNIKRSLLGLYLVSPFLSATDYSLDIINDTSSVLSGGVSQSSVSRTLVIGSLEHKINENYSFYGDLVLQRGDNGSDDTGDLQSYSNIDEEDFSQLYEIWVEGAFEAHNLRFKVGQIDANTEFAIAESAGDFINSSMGFSPSITYMPTYPAPTLAGAVFWQASQSSTASFAMFSDESNKFDEVFSIAEWTNVTDKMLIKLGAWHQSGNIDKLNFNDQTKSNAFGFYALAEGELDFEKFFGKSLGWYSQIGYTNEELAEVYFHFGAGLILNNIFDREGDTVGVGVTHVKTSRYVQDELTKQETSFEFFYRFQVNDNLTLKPDIQYIIDPATDENVNNAFVVTLRTEVSF